MLREWHPGQRVTSIAVQSLGVGTILVPSISHVIVEWDDGSWSKERYQDLIYVGESKLEPLPIPTKGGNPIPRRGSNDNTLDGSRKLDFDPQEDFDDDTIPNQMNPERPANQNPYSSGSLNPEIFEVESFDEVSYAPDRGRFSNPALLRQQTLDSALERAMTNWLLQGGGDRMRRKI